MKQVIGINGYNDFIRYKHLNNASFYFGYIPSYWYEKNGFEISPNRRYRKKEQITDIKEIKMICEEKKDKKIYAALNTPYISKYNLDDMKHIVEELIETSIGHASFFWGKVIIQKFD